MRLRSPRLANLLPLLLLLLGTAAISSDASDDDALALESATVEQGTAASTRIFVEGALGIAEQRYGMGSRSISRLSIDGRHGTRLSDRLRAELSARLDTRQPEDLRVDNPVFSLREAFVGWQDDTARTVLDLGRINQRNGPAYGYNPTDFLRDGSLRTVVTVNPLEQRENRLGSVMARWQGLWPDGGASFLVSPRLAHGPSSNGMSFDWGATNNRNRAVASYSGRLGKRASGQLLAYKGKGLQLQWGATGTALLSDAMVTYAEWSWSRERDLLSKALATSVPETSGNRIVAGLTYTTAGKLSITTELQYNRFALNRDTWEALAGAPQQVWALYYLTAQDLHELASRTGLLVYATQKDLFVKKLDLTGFIKFNGTCLLYTSRCV